MVRRTVSHQIPLLPESQTTLDAHETLLVRVDPPMQSHFVGHAERPTTDVAGERLVAGVRVNVRPKCRPCRKATIAQRAFKGQRVDT